MKLTSLCIFLSLVIVNIAYASTISVVFDGGTYRFSAEFNVDASPKRIMNVLTDYEKIKDLNPIIISSELLPSPRTNITRIRTVLHDCVVFFCRNIVRVEDVSKHGYERLEAYIVPMMSDLRSGEAIWTLSESSIGTTVYYEANMQPKFWVPPFIRSFVLTRKFKQRVLESVERLKKEAEM